VNRLIVSHSLFSLLANPVRYIWGLSAITFVMALLFFGMAVVFYVTNQVAAFAAIVALLLFIMAFSLFVAGIVFKQGNMIQRELWAIQSRLHSHEAASRAEVERTDSKT
jgi:hypothetical protein